MDGQASNEIDSASFVLGLSSPVAVETGPVSALRSLICDPPPSGKVEELIAAENLSDARTPSLAACELSGDL